jgi:hypothetical protein
VACAGHTFKFDTRVLSFKGYDLILGADWLEEHSPMWFHWKKKWMKFTYQNKRILSKGVRDDLIVFSQVPAHKLKGLLKRGVITHMLELHHARSVQASALVAPLTVAAIEQSELTEDNSLPQPVQSLLHQFDHLFQEPTSLPPQRAFDHQIPIVVGAPPVNGWSYRYASQQKDEIERQVNEMLKTGIIRHSVSSFASPIHLVKKKDGTWRFCVDYRHLNSITIKYKHPLPVVDGLLDELAGAAYFSKLDYRSGYHQIRIAEGDELKTAFRTHSGLYEFRVMPFGLTNAPATFQGAMNAIFASLLLRKCVLIFMDDILVYSRTMEEHGKHLSEVFQILQANHFLLKKSKCAFAQTSFEYLGHIVSVDGVATEPSNIQAVTQWAVPSNVK